MTKKEKIKFIEYLRLKTRFEDASQKGTMLMLEGRYCDSETAARTCVFNDTGYYMNELGNNSSGPADVLFIGICGNDH